MKGFFLTEDPQTGDRLEMPQRIGTMHPAKPETAAKVIAAPDTGNDGRSPWYWLRINGDLMMVCYPQGDTYIMTEEDMDRP